MLLEQRLTHADHVHHREDAGLLVVGLLDLAVIREQARHVRRAAERRGPARRHQRVDLAGLQHRGERLALGYLLQLDAGRQIERDLLDAPRFFQAAVAPAHRRGRHAVFVLEDAADPHRRGHLKFRHADHLALQIGGRADALRRVDVDAGVPEHAAHEHRHRAVLQRRAAVARERHGAAIGAERQFAGVELREFQRAEERLLHGQRKIIHVAAFDLHAPVHDGARAVVVPAGDGDREVGHSTSLFQSSSRPERARLARSRSGGIVRR